MRAARLPQRTTLVAAVVLMAACGEAEPPPRPHVALQPRLVFIADTTSVHFGKLELRGIPSRFLRGVPETAWPLALRVHTGDSSADAHEQPAIAGKYTLAGDTLRFRPRFALQPDLICRARFDGARFDSLRGARSHSTPSAALTFRMPQRGVADAAHVVGVFPSAPQLPENLLRVYVHFSAPMRAKNIQDHVRLVDADGREVELAFVEVKHGLWDPFEQRLTLFFHPGRIKRGVAPNRALGPPLQAGATYRLVVDAGALDARGHPVRAGYEHRFEVVEADRESPDPSAWVIVAPRRGRDPVSLEFPEPLDRAMLERMLGVIDAAGHSVDGSIAVSEQERRWSFVPLQAWVPGWHAIQVSWHLEDLAGNTPQRLFDEDRVEASPRAVEADTTRPIELRFEAAGR